MTMSILFYCVENWLFLRIIQKTAEVHCHNTRYATNQNYFIQVSTNAGKKQFLIEELLYGQM